MGDSTAAVITSLSRSIPVGPSTVPDLTQFLRRQASEASLSERIIERLVLAVGAACAKTISHSTAIELTVTWRTFEGGIDGPDRLQPVI